MKNKLRNLKIVSVIMSVFSLIIILLFNSCATTKHVLKEDVKASAQNDITETLVTHEEEKTESGWFITLDEFMTVIERITSTQYSTPDSAGVQYPETVTTAEREVVLTKKESNEGSTIQDKAIDTDSEKQTTVTAYFSKNTEENEVKKKNQAAWIIPLILSILLFISILINVLQAKRR